MKMIIYVTPDNTFAAAAKRTWTEFDDAIQLPFDYERPATFDVSNDTEVSDTAECAVHDGTALLRLAPAFFGLSMQQQSMTLLHEAMHIASIIGPLRHMYAAVKEFTDTFPIPGGCFDMGRNLARHLYEVDAEFALQRVYPQHAADRAECYVSSYEDSAGSWYAELPLQHPARSYAIACDRLKVELAGLLTRDQGVTRRLVGRLDVVPNSDAGEVEALHRMLSPKSNDFGELARWGADTYAAVVRRVTERLSLRVDLWNGNQLRGH